MCSVDGCGRKTVGRGLCNPHYRQARRGSQMRDPREQRGRNSPVTVDWLMERAEPIPWSGCWIWMAGLMPNGYGSACVNGKSVNAHRAMFSAKNGPIPKGLVVRHTCDVRECVNPDHLILGTQKDNIRDMHDRGRYAGGRRKERRTA